MRPLEDWESLRQPRAQRGRPAISPVRVALLFGSAAIAFALMAVSFLGEGHGDEFADAAKAGVDSITTGSVNTSKTYIIRKSVLQNSPNAVCVILPNGSSTGEC